MDKSGQECQGRNIGHIHGGGSAGQIIMIFLKLTEEMEDVSPVDWAITNVARRGDTVIVLGLLPVAKKCRPNLRNTFAFVCQGVCTSVHEIMPLRARQRRLDEQTFKDSWRRRILKILPQPCKVKIVIEILQLTIGLSLRRTAAQHALASNAGWVILDSNLRKARQFFVKELPCNLVLMTRSRQGCILQLEPGWRLQHGDSSLEAFSADESQETRVPILLPDTGKDRRNKSISEDSSDYTGSGDSDLSSHGGDKNPQVQQRASINYPEKMVGSLTGVRGHDALPPAIKEHYEDETSSGDESYYSSRDSPLTHWTSGTSSPARESSNSAATWKSVVSLPLCKICKFKVPEFGKPKKIPLAELMEATNNFSESNHLANCKLGTVYKGFLHNGQAVSVKRMDVNSETYPGDVDFFSEIGILSIAHHRNVVTLIGFCIDNGERLLVFEFACNKDLSWHLLPHLNQTPLTWNTRRKIAVEIARGMRYLHEECRAGSISHGSMEPKSILLTHDFSPVICNFSEAWLRPHADRALAPRSKHLGYVSKEVKLPSSLVTTEVDVYDYGMLLLDLISGGIKAQQQGPKVPAAALSALDMACLTLDGSPSTLLDPALENTYDENELHRMLRAASQCIQTESSLRPSISKVLSILEGQHPEEEDKDIYAWDSNCHHTAGHFEMISSGLMVLGF